MKHKRTLSVISMVFYSFKTILPVVLLYELLMNVFLIMFPGSLTEEFIDAGEYSTPFLLIILGGVLAYRLTGIAAANSVGKRALSLGVVIAAIPVAAAFSAMDLLTRKLVVANIYGKQVRFFLEIDPDAVGYSIASICDITDVKRMLILFGLTVLLYFWALLAGWLAGMFITNRCKVKITLMVITIAVSIILYFAVNMSGNSYWSIGVLLISLINPVVFVYSSFWLLYIVPLLDIPLGWMALIVCGISLITIFGNILLIRINVPAYKHRRRA